MEEKRPGEYFPVFEDERGSYILNAKDLCMVEHIKELVDAGVTSPLKLRDEPNPLTMWGVITNAYRAAVDLYAQNRGVPASPVDCR